MCSDIIKKLYVYFYMSADQPSLSDKYTKAGGYICNLYILYLFIHDWINQENNNINYVRNL